MTTQPPPAADSPADEVVPSSHDDIEEPVLLPPRGLWAVALALFAIAAAAGVLWSPPARTPVRPSLALHFWQEADLAQMRARDEGLLRQPPSTSVQALEASIVSGFSNYLGRESRLAADVDQDPEARKVLGQVEEDVRRLVEVGGIDALQRLAVRFGREVAQKMQATVLAAHAAERSVDTHLHTVPMPADVSAVEATAGTLGRVLARSGVGRDVRSGVLDPASVQLIEAIAQARFLQLAARVPGDPPQLPSDTWLLIQRFRVEAHQGIGLARRLELLGTLEKSDPAYPSDFVRGVLLAREERFADAHAAFQRASKNGNLAKQARDNARWCLQRLSQRQTPASTSLPPPEP